MQYFLVHRGGIMLGLFLENNTLIGEQHEVVNKDFSGLGHGILRRDRAVGFNFEGEFLVVCTLLHTIRVDREAYITNRSIDSIDVKGADGIISMVALFSGHISATFIDCDLQVEIC